jgi:hypothetical protein
MVLVRCLLAFNNYAIMGESNSLSFAPALTL